MQCISKINLEVFLKKKNCFPFGENMPIFCSLGADNYNIIK